MEFQFVIDVDVYILGNNIVVDLCELTFNLFSFLCLRFRVELNQEVYFVMKIVLNVLFAEKLGRSDVVHETTDDLVRLVLHDIAVELIYGVLDQQKLGEHNLSL